MMFSLCNEVWITTEMPEPDTIIPDMDDVVITPIICDDNDDDKSDTELSSTDVQSLFTSGVHFLTHESLVPKQELVDDIEESNSSGFDMFVQGRRDLLEYVIQDDGSAVCKWCGEVLPSRTHWYRHKYKKHVNSPPSTANLFKCSLCNVFFKSRKGYIGHVSTRHSSENIDSLDNDITSNKDDIVISGKGTNCANSIGTVGKVKRCNSNSKNSDDFPPSVEEYVKQREKEEKLVAEIIDRVRKECEAQGSTVTRRGYSRRSTVMNS